MNSKQKKRMRMILIAVFAVAVMIGFAPQMDMQVYAEDGGTETIDVKVEKKWVADDDLSVSVIFDLYRWIGGGEGNKEKVDTKMETLNSDTEWYGVFSGVPRFDPNQNEYTYEVVETIYDVTKGGRKVNIDFSSEVKSRQLSNRELEFEITNTQVRMPAMVPGTESVLKKTANTDNAQTVWYADKIWLVIGYNGNGAAGVSGAATLLSANNLVETEFDEISPTSNTYADSTLRNKIEGYEEGGVHIDGVLDSFSDSEQEAIKTRNLKHGTYDGRNTDCIAGDADLKDVALWPLSTKEANTVNSSLRIVDPEHPFWITSYWWLRSPGNKDNRAARVEGTGQIDYEGISGVSPSWVRPAFYLNLESVLFTSAASGGKSSGASGVDALQTQSGLSNSGNEWKVTVKDNAHAGFSISRIAQTENGVSVKYTGAATGTNEYISAIITDKPIAEADASIKYYGRIAAASDANAASVTINTAGKLGENDHLYVFNEQYNGDKKTDYASNLIEVTIPKPEPEPTPVKKISGTLLAKLTAKGTTSLCVEWGKINGAKGYDIFFAKYGKLAPKKVKTIKGNKTFRWTNKGLKAKTAYKAYVKAWVMKDGKKKYVKKSPLVYAYTSGSSERYTNAKSVTVKKKNVSLRLDKKYNKKTYKIKARVHKLVKAKKLMGVRYTKKLRYISSNTKIATVSSSGKITGVGKGNCKIYVFTHNGVKQTIKVTVK